MTSSARLISLLEAFPKVRVGVIGDLMVDRFIYGEVQRISPEAPVPVVRIQRRTTQPGGAANVAANVISLGGQCALFGALGNDEAGREARELLGAVELSGVVSPPSYPSTVKTRVVARSQHMLRIDEEETGTLDAAARQLLLDALAQQLPQLDVLVVSDYAKGIFDPDGSFAGRMLELSKAAGVPVIVDPKPENAATFRGARLIKPNLGEAKRIAGLADDDKSWKSSEGMRRICEAVRTATGVEEVLVTAGASGLVLLSGADIQIISGHPRDVFDVAGAGDSTVAAIALALGAGATSLEAAEMGNLAGSLAVGKLGVVAIAADELRQEIVQLGDEEAVHGQSEA